VWISSSPRPRTTRQALRSAHRQFASLKSTLGDQNYLLPANVTAADVRSIVIWCEPVQIAYTAASLAR
jgi:glutathione S-transferase